MLSAIQCRVLFCALALLVFSAGCDKTPLDPLQKGLEESNSVITGNYCNLGQVDVPGLKFLFLMDTTGSNLNGDTADNGVRVVPTDPGPNGDTKPKRVQAMLQIVQRFPHAQFALRAFAGGSGLPNDPDREWFSGSSSPNQIFQDPKTFVNQTIPFFENTWTDGNGTNYFPPLTNTMNDLDTYLKAQMNMPTNLRDPQGALVIIFATDGMPSNPGADDVTNLGQLAKSILGLPINDNAGSIIPEIIIDAAGYGGTDGGIWQQDATESRYLQSIASAGGGNMILFTNNTLDFTLLNLPAARAGEAISSVLFATNFNVVYESGKDGVVQALEDSDGDGLSDQLESALGSSPSVADTDGNGLGDGFEKFIFGTPCQQAGCASPGAGHDTRRYTSCDAIPDALGGPTGHYARDRLNNCEEEVAGANYLNFSLLNDNIPNGEKVLNGFSPADATLYGPDRFGDGLRIVDEVMLNVPLQMSASAAMAAGYLRTSYNISGANQNSDGESCFDFTISHFPVIGSEPNHIRIWLVQSNPNKDTLLRVADTSVLAGQTVNVTNADFTPNQ